MVGISTSHFWKNPQNKIIYVEINNNTYKHARLNGGQLKPISRQKLRMNLNLENPRKIRERIKQYGSFFLVKGI